MSGGVAVEAASVFCGVAAEMKSRLSTPMAGTTVAASAMVELMVFGGKNVGEMVKSGQKSVMNRH